MNLTHVKQLEAESIYIFREVYAQFQNPVVLYSVGKDSSVLLRLAQKAFYPASIPFPFVHIDTGFKFQQMYEFRDQMSKDLGFELVVKKNEEAIQRGANPFDLGTQKCCGFLKTQALLNGLKSLNCDAAIGGARRDEEKSRAKERIYSFRDVNGQWDPKNQRPELWNLYNGRINPGESIRVFPLSNWTELDVWLYIYLEKIPIVPLYYAAEREMIETNGQLIPAKELGADKKKNARKVMCRFRSLGCSPCTGAIRSEADTLPKIIEEVMTIRSSERSTRVIDHDTEGSMEIKKQEGYF